ncbi:hypothetical protein CDD83_7943 [Cordyceps sp. RAO-2017]|nr:hypothetical protein CDD83_7943 [Cordyceps sp. RAO-2017]
MTLEMDKEFAQTAAPLMRLIANQPELVLHDVAPRRKALAAFFPAKPAIPPGVLYDEVSIPAADGVKIRILRLRKKKTETDEDGAGDGTDATSPGPAVIHIHGGGFVALTADVAVPSLCHHVLATGVQFFSVDYRLAPEHPYPTPLHDCWAALAWVAGNADELGVDRSRIGVMGESAGGGLAAALTLLARERALSPPLARQILAAPMLDDRTRADVELGGFSTWTPRENATGWAAYLGAARAGTADVPATAAPARVDDVAGLPPLYLDVGQLDLFFAEGAAYAAKFWAAKIETEFHLMPGLPHGFEGLAPDHPASQAVRANRDRQLRKLYE